MHRCRARTAVLVLIWSAAWTATSMAQPDAGPGQIEEPPNDARTTQGSNEPGQDSTEPGQDRTGATRSVEERLRALEAREAERQARDAERESELARALERVAELERAQEASASAAAVDAAPATTSPSLPALRPLASLFSRAEVRDGYASLGAPNPGCFGGATDGACLRYRARVGLELSDMQLADELTAAVRFLPQATGYWSLGGSGGVGSVDLGIYEANLVLRIASAVRVDAGRIVLNYGDELVIGKLGWHPAARAFDGARLRIQPDADGFWIDAFWTLLQEGGSGSFGAGDRYFYGAYAGLGPLLGAATQLDVYALALQDNETVDATGALVDWSLRVHLGGRFTHRIDIVDLRAETGVQLGRSGDVSPADPALIVAGHLDGEVGVNLLDDRLRLSGHGFYASGDDPTTEQQEAYDQLFPTAHAFLGLTDVTGARTNVAGGAAHVSGRPLPQLRVSLDVFVFARPEGAADPYAGTEADLQLLWLPGAGLRVRGLYGLYVPNPGHWGFSTDPVHYVEVELGLEV